MQKTLSFDLPVCDAWNAINIQMLNEVKVSSEITDAIISNPCAMRQIQSVQVRHVA